MTHSDRSAQLSKMIEAHSSHRQLIGLTQTFKSVREIQGKLLRNLPKARRILLLGPGEGDEIETVLHVAEIDPKSLDLVAVEVSVDRAAIFKKRFPHATVIVDDFSDGNLHLPDQWQRDFDVIQAGFVLNDQTERGKNAILESCFQALRNQGAIIVSEILMQSCPNLDSYLTTTEATATLNNELREYYETYLVELKQMTAFPTQAVAELSKSIESAWSDALQHREGRETFETRATLEAKLGQAGFAEINFENGYNKSAVIVAVKNELIA